MVRKPNPTIRDEETQSSAGSMASFDGHERSTYRSSGLWSSIDTDSIGEAESWSKRTRTKDLYSNPWEKAKGQFKTLLLVASYTQTYTVRIRML